MNATVYVTQSDSNPSATYTQLALEDGRWTCTCPGYQYRGKTCKHIDRLVGQGKGYDAPKPVALYEIVAAGDSFIAKEEELLDIILEQLDRTGADLSVERLN